MHYFIIVVRIQRLRKLYQLLPAGATCCCITFGYVQSSEVLLSWKSRDTVSWLECLTLHTIIWYNLISVLQQEVKVSSPDYSGMTSEDALNDFLQRIEHYMDMYQPLDEEAEDHLSFMKVYNTGKFCAGHLIWEYECYCKWKWWQTIISQFQ